MSMALVRNGAEGETKQAIGETMSMEVFPEPEINANSRKIKKDGCDPKFCVNRKLRSVYSGSKS
jgi:hypothetical protein